MKKIILSLIFCIASFSVQMSALAQDNAETRKVAADRYLRAVPMAKMLDDTFSEMAKQMPVSDRANFMAQMKTAVRADSLERICRDSMVKTFTVDELNALADFYGSKHGASAMQKFGSYMAQVMPAVQQEVEQAMQKTMQKPKGQKK